MLFFFVKHKTTYEMRMSDWSSDVCSSDLQSSASASSPAPATILMLVKDAANGAAASTENGTSTPPRSAPRSTKHDSGTFTVFFSRGIHFAIAGAMSKSAPPIDSVTADVGACTGTMSKIGRAHV